MGNAAKALEKPFRTGKSAAERANKRQQREIAKQRQEEAAALAEEDDEVARRLAAGNSAKYGRRSLIKTSEVGTMRKTLG